MKSHQLAVAQVFSCSLREMSQFFKEKEMQSIFQSYSKGLWKKKMKKLENTFSFHGLWTVLVLIFSYQIPPGISVHVCHSFAVALICIEVSNEVNWN